MTKRLELNESLKQKIRAAVGADIDFSKIAAYESVAASTRPITQKNTAYNGAQMSKGFLEQMVASLADESVPLHIMHEGQWLPIGKVFDAGVFDAEQGHHELRTLFYVEADGDHAKKIDLGIVDEVSVGALPKHAFCSECDFDYAAPGNEFAFYFRECDEGHVIGVDGVHLRLTALAGWKELSLVGKGASSKPKIVGKAQQRLSKESLEQLAASGHSPEALQLSYLLCPATETQLNDEGDDMSLLELSQRNEALSAEKAKLEVELQGTKDKLQNATNELTASQDKVKELESQLKAKGDSETEKSLQAAQEKLDAQEPVLKFFREEAKKAAVAAGIELKDEASLEDCMETVKSAQIKLAALPRGGVAKGAADDGDDDQTYKLQAARNSAFLGAN